ncbi:MAG TPA: hypothetical protein VHP61_04485 [Acidobacteriota bacterium]|nr:hypothetical protein [Acidobacteriota bacterium]
MGIFVLWAAILLATAPPASPSPQVKTYRLAGIVQGGDFDLRAFRDIDSLPVPYPPGSKTQIGELPLRRGKFLIYKFVAAYAGTAAGGGAAEFHDLLALKVGCSDEILDAWQYTLEWADTPSLDLNRMRKKGLILKKGLEVGTLDLANAATGSVAGEEGVIE